MEKLAGIVLKEIFLAKNGKSLIFFNSSQNTDQIITFLFSIIGYEN